MMRFGLIGHGAIGRLRAKALTRSRSCSLTAIFDQDPAAMTGLPPGVTTFPSAAALIASDRCDAVVISTPPDSHESFAVTAMESGKGVIVEKPMANTLAACRRMIDVSRRTGRLLTIGYNHRYFAGVKVVRDAVHSGAIGRLRKIRAYAGHVGLAEFKAPWMYDRSVMGGGTLMDNGTHLIDLVAHIMGTVGQVSGIVSSDIWKLEVEDNGALLMSNADGVFASVQSSWSAWAGYEVYVEAVGELGLARCDLAPMRSTVVRSESPGGGRSLKRKYYPEAIVREKLFGWQTTAVRTLVDEFSDFSALAADPAATVVIARAEDGLRAVAVAQAAYESSATGKAVAIQPY